MNHDCNGDFYTFACARFYRCLLDSTVISEVDDLSDGDDCPNCQRTIHGVDRGSVTRSRTIVTLEVEYGGEYYTHSESVLEQDGRRPLEEIIASSCGVSIQAARGLTKNAEFMALLSESALR